jgi:ABC-type polysaccharide/polyol phosphate transport system ATPase subunit
MSEKAIIIKGLSKEYLKNGSKGSFSRNSETFTVLDNINVEIDRGQTIGVIGPNGAGKTTLFKIIGEIVPPSKGSVEVFGKVVSILQVGIGFQPELSGYENIFLAGSLYDIGRNKVKEKIDEIVEMFGFPDFLHTPVKYYSSGMYMRLAFAVISHVDADIFLFDEILGVGDRNFRDKVFSKIQELQKNGKTILVITHAAQSIIKLFNRIILINSGKIAYFGSPDAAIRMDYELLTNNSEFSARQKLILNGDELLSHQNVFNHDVEKKIHLTSLSITNVDGGSPLRNDCEISLNASVFIDCDVEVRIGFVIKDYNDNVISTVFTEIIPATSLNNTTNISAVFPANTFMSNFFVVDVVVVSGTDILMSYTHALKYRLLSFDRNNPFETLGYINPSVTFKMINNQN